MVKVKLLRPLDGRAIGDTAEYPEADAKRLAARGVVQFGGAKESQAPLNKAASAPANKSAPAKKKGS